MFSPLGQITEALSDIKVALDLKPSVQLHLMFGTLQFMKEVCCFKLSCSTVEPDIKLIIIFIS